MDGKEREGKGLVESPPFMNPRYAPVHVPCYVSSHQ